ncbi:MAG: hypothetical protein RI988_72 [Pseudomonadota bacterium]|jgi:hypothetical protein
MRVRVQFMLLALAAFSVSAWSGAPPPAPQAVSVYLSLGSRQCQDGGRTLAQVRQLLADAGVRVLSSGCGTDGMAYPAVCGAPDGRIVILEVPAEQVEAARKAGFALLSERPRAQRQAC